MDKWTCEEQHRHPEIDPYLKVTWFITEVASTAVEKGKSFQQLVVDILRGKNLGLYLLPDGLLI